MKKPTIFYFVHAHGNGHKATFNIFYPALSVFFNVIAITTNNEITEYLHTKHHVQVLELPPKYPADYEIPEHTFSKSLKLHRMRSSLDKFDPPVNHFHSIIENATRYQQKWSVLPMRRWLKAFEAMGLIKIDLADIITVIQKPTNSQIKNSVSPHPY